MPSITSPRAKREQRHLHRALSVAFLVTLVASLSLYVLSRDRTLSQLQEGIDVVAAALLSVPRLNLSQEFPLPSLGLLMFLLSCVALFALVARRLSGVVAAVRLAAATLACLSYAVIVHEALDCVSVIWPNVCISDASLGLTGLLLLIVLACMSIFKRWSARGRRNGPSSTVAATSGSDRLGSKKRSWLQSAMLEWESIVLGLCLLAGILSYSFAFKAALSNPPLGWDGLWYHLPVAISILQFGTLRAFWLGGISSTPITLHASNPVYAYPAAGSILYSVNLRAGADRWSFLWQMLGVCLLFGATYVLSEALGASKRLALVVSLVCILTPIVVMQSTTVMVDNLWTGFASMSFALLILLLSAPQPGRCRRGLFFVAGLGSGLGAATKLAGLPTALLWLAAASVVSYATRDETARLGDLATEISLFCGGALAVGGYWYIRNWILLGNPVYPFRLGLAGLTLFQGLEPQSLWAAKELQFVGSRAEWASALWNDPIWSYEAGTGLTGAVIFPAVVFGGVCSLFLQRARQKIGTWLMLVMLALSVAVWWVFTQHEPRYLIVMLPFCFSLLSVAWTQCEEWVQRGVGVLLAVGLISSVPMLAQAFAPSISAVYDRKTQYSWAIGAVVEADWIDGLPEGTIILNDSQGERGWVTLSSNYPLAGLRHGNVVLTDPHLLVCESEAESIQRLTDGGVSFIYRRVEASSPPRCYENWAQIRRQFESTSDGHTVKVFHVLTH